MPGLTGTRIFREGISQKGVSTIALFNDSHIAAVLERVQKRQQELAAALGLPPQTAEPSAAPPLAHDLHLLIQIANGEMLRAHATPAQLEQVEQALQRLLDLLLGNALAAPITYPDGFWTTDLGVLVSRVRWWLSADDLITISNAAALAYGENTQANRMRIARAIQQGLLDWIPDPSVANPQQNKRVLRTQVERLRALNSPPA